MMVAMGQPIYSVVNLRGFECYAKPPANHHKSLVDQRRRGKKKKNGGLKGGLKDACRVRSGAGEGEIVRWAAFLSAEVMAEW